MPFRIPSISAATPGSALPEGPPVMEAGMPSGKNALVGAANAAMKEELFKRYMAQFMANPAAKIAIGDQIAAGSGRTLAGIAAPTVEPTEMAAGAALGGSLNPFNWFKGTPKDINLPQQGNRDPRLPALNALQRLMLLRQGAAGALK